MTLTFLRAVVYQNRSDGAFSPVYVVSNVDSVSPKVSNLAFG